MSATPERLRAATDAVLAVALVGLGVEVKDNQQARLAMLRITARQTVAAAERELRALGSRDRARVTAELALSCALLHLRLSELTPDELPADLTADRQALTVPLAAPRAGAPR